MASIVRILGIERLTRSLRQSHARCERGVARGLVKAGKLLQRASQEVVPVDVGFLRASAFTRWAGSGFGREVRVGYDAGYAASVHEEMSVTHGQDYNEKHAMDIAVGAQYWYKGQMRTYHARKPEEQAKFLQEPLLANLEHMGAVIRKEALG